MRRASDVSQSHRTRDGTTTTTWTHLGTSGMAGGILCRGVGIPAESQRAHKCVRRAKAVVRASWNDAFASSINFFVRMDSRSSSSSRQVLPD